MIHNWPPEISGKISMNLGLGKIGPDSEKQRKRSNSLTFNTKFGELPMSI